MMSPPYDNPTNEQFVDPTKLCIWITGLHKVLQIVSLSFFGWLRSRQAYAAIGMESIYAPIQARVIMNSTTSTFYLHCCINICLQIHANNKLYY